MKQKSIASLIKAGKYSYVNSDIMPEHFPNTDIRGEVELVHTNKDFIEAEGIAILKENGLEPATAYELIAWGAENHDAVAVTEWGYIIALGDSWLDPSRARRIVDLYRSTRYRELRLADPGNWFGDCCVLAGVRRRKQPELENSEADNSLTLNSLALRVIVLEDKMTKVSELLNQ